MPKSKVEFLQQKFDDNTWMDQLVREMLENQGVRCIVVWECTIKKMQKDSGVEAEEMDTLIKDIQRANKNRIDF